MMSFFIGEPRLRMCMTHFILGIIIALNYPKLINTDFKSKKAYRFRWLLYPIIISLYSLRNIKAVLPEIKPLFDFLYQHHIRWEHFSAIAAFLIIGLVAMNRKTQIRLEHPLLLFLGKISYSIYLIHWVLVLYIMNKWEDFGAYLGEGYFRFYTLLILYLGIVIILATLMYNYIEKPFIQLSKNIWRSKQNPKQYI